MAKVIVTGAFGFIATHLIEALLKNGDEVIGFDKKDITPPHMERWILEYSYKE